MSGRETAMTCWIGVGMSRHADTITAVKEAVQKAINEGEPPFIEWAMVFCTTRHIPQADLIRTILFEQTGCNSFAGCSGIGVLTGEGEIYNAPGIAVMLGWTPEHPHSTFVTRQRLPNSPSVSQQMKEWLEQFQYRRPLLFFFPDTFEHQPYNFINTFNYTANHPLVYGAGACDDGQAQFAVEIGANEIVNDGIAGLCLSGFRYHLVGVTQSTIVLGEPMFITKIENNQILEIDGLPALEVYVNAAVELGFPDIETAAQQLMLNFPLNSTKPQFLGETSLARNLAGIDVVSQGLEVPELLKEGSVVSFSLRNRIAAEEDMELMLTRLQKVTKERPSFGIYFNCSARGEALYNETNVDVSMIRQYLGEFPLIGFFGGYELAHVPSGLQLYSYTGVLVLVYL